MNDSRSTPYTILPLQFSRMFSDKVLLTNEAGEFFFINPENFQELVTYKLNTSSSLFYDLKGKHLVTDTDIHPVIDLLATKYRTKMGFLRNFTVLHMVVITVRCNHKCRYCHASSEESHATQWDMNQVVAEKVVDTIFQSPSTRIKIEFQGGEPLLNWERVKYIVKYAKKINKHLKKDLSFVLCTNLTLMNEEKLNFIKKQNILISTSLDGPKDLHDNNRRLRQDGSSYDIFLKKLELTKSIIGNKGISALLTITKDSLSRIDDIIDEYVDKGFNGIFLRALNPFGYAKNNQSLGYNVGEYFRTYKKALDYIIKTNLEGTYFEEFYTTLLLSRIMTPFSTGFVDLQSPAGTGISCAVYDFNGDVYPSDEARMLGKMGIKKFLMGNVLRDEYIKIFNGDVLRELINNSCVETLPGCAWCVFQQYCGADPIRNFSTQGDITGHRPTNEFCKKNMAIIKYLFELIIENNDDVMDVFWSWITKRPLEELRNVEL
jgi:His-Xaa-Ser system radical SAM maturase HxsB